MEEVIRYRHGEAHLGVVRGADGRRLLVSFFKGANALLRVSADNFWLPHEALVRVTLDDNAVNAPPICRQSSCALRRPPDVFDH